MPPSDVADACVRRDRRPSILDPHPRRDAIRPCRADAARGGPAEPAVDRAHRTHIGPLGALRGRAWGRPLRRSVSAAASRTTPPISTHGSRRRRSTATTPSVARPSSTRSISATAATCASSPMRRWRSWSPHRRTSPVRSTRRRSAKATYRATTSTTCRCCATSSPSACACLEPGGRIAVNVANLGRRPYRNLAADVTAILQDDLRLLLRGEVIWLKRARCVRLVCVGLLPVARQPRAARHHRAIDRRQQGPLRSCRARARGARRCGHDPRRRVHGSDARRVGDPGGVGDQGRTSRAVPGGARRALSAPVHLHR